MNKLPASSNGNEETMPAACVHEHGARQATGSMRHATGGAFDELLCDVVEGRLQNGIRLKKRGKRCMMVL
jgi:hypothetical protein